MSRRSRRERRNRQRLAPANSDPTDAPNPGQLARPSQQRQVTFTQATRTFRGPLPPPETLAEYDRIYQGCAQEIVAMARSQQTHRQGLETAVVRGNIAAEERGQIFAFILGLVVVVGGITLIAFGKPVSGLTSIITAFVTLAGVFIYGRWQQKRERQNKREELNNPQLNLPYDQPT